MALSGLCYQVEGRLRSLFLLAFVIDEKLGELLFQGLCLGQVAHLNIWVAGIMESVVLVIVFRAVEALQRRDLSNDRRGEDLGPVQLGNIVGCDALLLVIRVEDGRTVRSTNVRSLPIELRGIVDHR